VYVRIARFEGRDPSAIDEQVASMKSQFDASRSGQVPAEAPEQVQTLMETVKRFMELVDRDTGTSLGITFCATEQDLERANAALDAMSPPEGTGTARPWRRTRSRWTRRSSSRDGSPAVSATAAGTLERMSTLLLAAVLSAPWTAAIAWTWWHAPRLDDVPPSMGERARRRLETI
jgi:hypothetical protein